MSIVAENPSVVPAATADPSAQGGATGLPQTVLTILGAIGTGIGVLGFVTFLGGAILWIKAKEANLPATESVAIIPKEVLLTQGAEVASIAVIVAVVAVGFLYLFDRAFGHFNKLTLNTKRELEDEYGADIKLAEESLTTLRLKAEQSRRLADETRQLAKQETDVSRKQELLNGAAAHDQTVENDQTRLEEAQQELERAKQRLENFEKSSTKQVRAERVSRGVTNFVLLIGVPCAFAIVFFELSDWGVAGVVAVAAFGSLLSLIVLLGERWIWFGVAAFLTVSVALTTATFIRTSEELKVEPAAVLRADAGPVCGFFVAQTSTHVYLGTYERRVALEGGTSRSPGTTASECTGTEPPSGSVRQRTLPPRLMSIPNDQITDTSVGPPLPLARGGLRDDAPTRSAAMALDLCERRLTGNGAKAASRAKAASKKSQEAASKEMREGCSKDQIRGLREVATPASRDAV